MLRNALCGKRTIKVGYANTELLYVEKQDLKNRLSATVPVVLERVTPSRRYQLDPFIA